MSPDNSTAGSFRLTPWKFLPVSDPNEKKPDYLEWLTKLDDDETWDEHPRDLTWLTEMEIPAIHAHPNPQSIMPRAY